MRKLIRVVLLILLISIIVLFLFPARAVSAQQSKIYLWPSGGLVSGTVLLRGTNFPGWKNVLIFFEGKQVSSAFTRDGYDFETNFQVPPVAGGYKAVEVRTAEGEFIARAYFHVEPQRLHVSSQRGTIGSAIAIWGSGFPPGNNVIVQMGDRVVASVVIDANGYFGERLITIPLTTLPGWHVVEAFSGGVGAAANFEIMQPIVVLSSYVVNPGDRVTVSVWGALPFAPVNIFIGGREITPYSAIVGQNGVVEIHDVFIPDLPWGWYSIKVKTGSLEGSQLITVLQESLFKVAKVLSPISNEVVRVWSYDRGQWKLYDPAVPAISDLKEFESGRAYWVQVKNDCVFVGANNIIYQLFKGWNLIGW